MDAYSAVIIYRLRQRKKRGRTEELRRDGINKKNKECEETE